MAKTTTKPRRSSKPAKSSPEADGRGIPSAGRPAPKPHVPAVGGKQLVIVESPSKAKTINKYLGSDFVVLASVGHVRDLPERNPKGVKSPVPGVDLKHDFAQTYHILPGKEKTINELKRAAKAASQIWFATDLDREGEAIAWHLAEELGIDPKAAKRVMFAAITKDEIKRAFENPHPIDMDRVNAQQARRVVDRIVGYQVSPLLWKKVARGLSAGRVQSVAVRLVVEREREIRGFIPDEFWNITANFSLTEAEKAKLAAAWPAFMAEKDEKGNPPSGKAQLQWLADHKAIPAELVEVAGEKFEINAPGHAEMDLTGRVREVAALAGLKIAAIDTTQDEKGRGPAKIRRTVRGTIDPAAKYAVSSIETKRTSVRPAPPFITSTLQQAGSTRLGFGARRTMQAAQALYEGVNIPGEGPVGLITYMRTDSTHLSGAALEMARTYIQKKFGDKYLPEKPNFFASSNKAAQEAHEAIRPASLDYPPERVRNALRPDHFRLYQIIWDRFVACQMTPAQWDSTTVLISGGTNQSKPCTFKATGRTLVFDGFYKVAGVPPADIAMLPPLEEKRPMHAFSVDALQKFTSPPARYSEASLIKALESEGIGRPSTYASIIQVIQDRKYVEQVERRMYATDLGEVVTDKLVEAFPKIMDVGYTRDMELQLDKIEEDHLDWVDMLKRFYGPFTKALEEAHETMTHAKAETTPAPDEYKCPQCGSGLVYRFGKSGKFLSCATYPTCTYACPTDREGRPRPAEHVDVACHKCGGPMIKRNGKFGPFLGCARYNDEKNPLGPCDGILNIDKKKGTVKAPSQPALLTDIPCPKCQSPMNLREGIRGPWLGCSKFPKCRGRGKWTDVPEAKQKQLEAELETHAKAHPIPIIRTLAGKALTDSKGKPLADAPKVEQLAQGEAYAGSVASGRDAEPDETEAEAA
ncbi:MAG TPA: DNA topoisomerase [Phycisphaerales bacterium]|nr:DNA topoisomerase [Phycisphaerales bacterium]